ncbi:glycogen phosphorylase [Mangrovactinospora gilvigrisea]|uniref:glycogen phosphorylase n=1 Tax=Mangrovactinospora gilvigrisea TaxID=1428644 RepID=A0A1J7C2V5_9ACTN|nr:alpha-glucan family phosphorylase [Mangrovactinospora gilvigrisea]OIV35900.1 glycogen phosphorylase [Mangrovactinospora gilvigrisea]
MKAIRRFTVRTVLPEALAPLGRLALNLRWSWHPETHDLLASIDPDAWRASGGNPVRLLGAVPAERLAELARNRRFLRELRLVDGDLTDYLRGDRWYQRRLAAGRELPEAVAYFSPEFGIAAGLPQYSGGLGILAGDHLKAASDLGVPLIGVGLLYRHGYFTQSLSRDGWQQEHYPVLDPDELPVEPTPITVALALGEARTLHAKVWRARVGRVPLLLLDSDLEENGPGEREVTDRLYGGGGEHRLRQEMLLGIGGVRAVRAFCALEGLPAPEVFHTNEGHAGFLGLERIREAMAADAEPKKGGEASFAAALQAVRGGTVFTTHTPVPAGIDRFDRQLVRREFGGGSAAPTLPGVPVEEILALGAEDWPDGDPHLFNMAAMGLRLAQRANGVSRLHGEVSRAMFAGLWPGFDPGEAPIASVTNGVHGPTWMDPLVREMGAWEIGAGPVDAALVHGARAEDETWDGVRRIPDADVWRLRRTLRALLVEEARERLRASWRARGAGSAELGWIERVLDPDVLTLGFARRVPSYKRLTLMLRDRERLTRMLLHPERPVQIVVAGKAHPADDGGKRLVQELVRFADDPAVRHRIVFLPDYGMGLARRMVSGCDVWLNNPLRPLEACGTSGMKAALNGCLNLSVRDGWWDEWYDPAFGWAVPSADGAAADGDPEARDAAEAEALYRIVEEQVAPRFYDRGGPEGLPTGWIAMVRETLALLGPKVLAGRMVREYVERLYAPAARAHRALAADGGAGAAGLAAFLERARTAWPAVRVDHVEAVGGPLRLGAALNLRVRVALGRLAPSEVLVELVSGRVDEDDRIVEPVRAALHAEEAGGDGGRPLYTGRLTLDRTGPFGYTVRVLARHPLLASPAEAGLVAVPSADAVPVDPTMLR